MRSLKKKLQIWFQVIVSFQRVVIYRSRINNNCIFFTVGVHHLLKYINQGRQDQREALLTRLKTGDQIKQAPYPRQTYAKFNPFYKQLWCPGKMIITKALSRSQDKITKKRVEQGGFKVIVTFYKILKSNQTLFDHFKLMGEGLTP